MNEAVMAGQDVMKLLWPAKMCYVHVIMSTRQSDRGLAWPATYVTVCPLARHKHKKLKSYHNYDKSVLHAAPGLPPARDNRWARVFPGMASTIFAN